MRAMNRRQAIAGAIAGLAAAALPKATPAAAAERTLLMGTACDCYDRIELAPAWVQLAVPAR